MARCTCEGAMPYGGSKKTCDCGSPRGSGCIVPFVLIIGGLFGGAVGFGKLAAMLLA